MNIFLKWRYLSSFVLLSITKAIAKFIFSVVIKVCYGIESILKYDENSSLSQNMLPRIKTNSMSDCGLSSTRSKASNSVDQNITNTSVRLKVTDLTSQKKFTVKHSNKHKVVANFSDVSYDDQNDFRNMAVTVKSTGSRVCLKFDRTLPGKILKSSTPSFHRSKTSLDKKIQPKTNGNKILPDRKPSLQNAVQVSIPNTCNASAENSHLKQDVSDEVHKLILNELNSSKSTFPENVSLIIPQQIVEHGKESSPTNSADLYHRNMHQENKLQSSKEHSVTDDEYHSENSTIIQNASQRNETENINFIDDEYHSDLVTAMTSASQRDDNESESQIARDGQCHTTFVTALQKEYQCHNDANVSENTGDGFEKNGHVKKLDCSEVKQVGGINEVSISLPKTHAQVHDCPLETGNDEFIEHLDHDTNRINRECHPDTAIGSIIHNDANVSENTGNGFEKNGHVKKLDCSEVKQVGGIKEVSISLPKTHAQVHDCPSETGNDEFIEHLDHDTNRMNRECHPDTAIGSIIHGSGCHSELITAIHNASQCDDNEGEKGNSIDYKYHSEVVKSLWNGIKIQNIENQLGESVIIEHVKGEKCIDIKQVAQTKKEGSAPNAGGNLTLGLKTIGCKRICSDETVLLSDVNTILEKSEARCLDNPFTGEDFIEVLHQQMYLNPPTNVLNSAFHFGNANNKEKNTSQSEKEDLNLLKTGKPEFMEFLKEINSKLQEIETDMLNLAKEHYCKYLIRGYEIRPVILKLLTIVRKSFEVNTYPYNDLVMHYIEEFIEVFEFVQNEIAESIGNSRCMKRSMFKKLLTRKLTENRNILFHANAETEALQKQYKKIVKFVAKQRKNRRRK